MKFYLKYILLGVVIGLLILGLISLAGCQSPTVKQNYFSDIDPNAPINTHLLKVSDSWGKEYGTSHESVLKYNTVAAWAFGQRALHLIAELDKRVKALEPVRIEIDAASKIGLDLEPVDPNEVKE